MMKRLSLSESLHALLGVVFLSLLLAVIPACAQEAMPKPKGAINDFAGVIPAEAKSQMENLSREVLQKTGTAIIVATVSTIGEDEINGYVNTLYSTWGIGKKGENKGVLIFVAVKERKMRIETGYGVEGILPDGLVGEIRDKYMIPYFRQGDFGKGLLNGMTAIASVIAKDANVTLTGNPKVETPHGRKKGRQGLSPFTIVALIVVVLLVLGTRQGRDMLPFLIGFILGGGGRGGSGGGGFDDFGGGGFGGFGGGDSGGGGAGGDF
ncbi:MAG: hypothetical protein CSYNP_01064 [Syntrophus sp. SKADARSKE-3]|nr:hypothetical protein [Syntrophus sp. SKADARSKE-3]